MLFIFTAIIFILIYPYITKRSALEAPFIFSIFLIIVLIGFALIDKLDIGYWFYIITISVGFFGCFIANPKKFMSFIGENKKNYLICGVFCGFLLLVTLVVDNNFKFSVWDEFSFWGTSIKYIYEAGALPVENSAMLFKRYPVGQQMFQFFFLKGFGWSERNVISAQLLLIGSCVLFVAAQFSNKFAGQFCAALTVVFVALFVGFTFDNIYADLLLGILFAAALAMVLNLESNMVELVLLSAISVVLTQIKEMGTLFAFIIIVLTAQQIVAKNIFISKCGLSTFFKKLYFPLFLAIFAFLGHYAWKNHVAGIGEAVPPLKHSITQLLSGAGLIRLGATLTTFTQKINAVSGAVSLYIVITTISLLLRFEIKRALFFAGLILSYIIYILVLLYLYLFIFSEYEGVRLASFERYDSTFLIAIFSIALLDLILEISNKLKDKYSITPILFVLFMVVLGSPSLGNGRIKLSALNIETKLDRAGVYQRCLHLSEILKKHADSNDKFFYVSQRSNGYDVHVCNYHTVPYQMPLYGPWSFGKPDPSIPDDQLYTFDKDLAEILKSYEWLVIFRSDQEFWSKYGHLFQDDGKELLFGVYRIDKSNDDIKLHMVD